jgi:TrmH family RNA methyltransferase
MLSRSHERLIQALQRRKERATRGLFLAEGVRVAEELAHSKIDLKFALASPALEDTPRGRDLLAILRKRTAVHELADPALRRLAATEQPQGVLVVASEPAASLAQIRIETASRVLVCDAVQDPGNLGTLIRSADAFGAAGVILLPGCVDAWNAKVVRAAAGSSFHLPVVSAQLDELVTWLRVHGFQIWGGAAHGEPYDAARTPARVALIVGNEGAGLRPETQALVDQAVRIEMPGRAESLNVGVAASILLYLLSQRNV